MTADDEAVAFPAGGLASASVPVPADVPPLVHVTVEFAAVGPQSEKVTVPEGVGGFARPVPWTVAISVTLVPGETSPPAPTLGLVESVASQTANWPRTKSFSTAVVEVEERVSDATDEKHSPPRPSRDRLTPPSYSSPWR